MKIKLTSIHVDDQDKALRFYTDAESQLALNDNPGAKADQQAKVEQGQPMVNDIRGNLIQIVALERWR